MTKLLLAHFNTLALRHINAFSLGGNAATLDCTRGGSSYPRYGFLPRPDHVSYIRAVRLVFSSYTLLPCRFLQWVIGDKGAGLALPVA